MNGIIFEYYLYNVCACLHCSIVCSLSNNCYCFLNRYVYITLIKWTGLQHCNFEFHLNNYVMCSTCLLIYFNKIYYPEFRWLFSFMTHKYITFWLFFRLSVSFFWYFCNVFSCTSTYFIKFRTFSWSFWFP